MLHFQAEIARDFAKRHPVLVIVVQQHVDESLAEVADLLLRHVALHFGFDSLLLLALLARDEFRDVLSTLLSIEFLRRSVERQKPS